MAHFLRTALVLITLLVLPAPVLAAPSILLSRNTGPPTTIVTITGSGFVGGKTVEFYFNDYASGQITSDSFGKFTFKLTVPDNTQPGKYKVLAVQEGTLFNSKTFIVRTNVAQFHGNDALHTGENKTENTINAANASQLLQLWSRALPNGTSGTPVVGDGNVFITGLTGNLYGFNAVTGAPAPGFPVAIDDFFSRGAPVYTPTGIFAASSTNMKLYGFNPRNGNPLPNFPIQLSSQNFGSLSEANGNLYVGLFNGQLDGYNKFTGAVLPNFPMLLDGGIYGSLTVNAGKGYVGTAGGTFYCIDFATGTFPWTFDAGAVITGTAAFKDGTVYFGTDDGKLHALSATTGRPRFGYPIQVGNHIGDTPVVAGDSVFFGSFDKQFRRHLRAGARRLWRIFSNSEFWGSAYATRSIVVIKSLNRLSVRSVLDGRELWGRNIRSSQTSSPVIANGVIYVGSIDGFIRAYSRHGVPPPPTPPGPGP